ncbi:galactokinase [Lentzea guizhouensis]|uniref:Galactokinase n=1 Tax=Lentzea guizhouensis TaxID=1586287 RepID=A0A1B2HB69_9PSEU|nr:galactokinase [Lentzea guizhouensis]ANZ34968.1 galactokinase [Lentzea guizhouensis]
MTQATTAPATKAAEAFKRLHGRAPDGVWSAPGRVNLIGEHTDYNDGYVLPFALPHRTAVAASPRADGVLTVSTLGDDGGVQKATPVTIAELAPGTVRGWAAYPSGVAWALREQNLPVTAGADLVIAGDVPAGAGLSSSHALECAVALALLGLADVPAERPDIARWVQRSENDFVGAPTGILDQTASLTCIEAHALFYDVRSGKAEQVAFDAAANGLEVLVIDTRASHSHVDGGYGARRAGCERAAGILGVPALRDVDIAELDDTLVRLPEELRPLVRHVVTENDRVLRTVELLRAGRLADIGPLLSASHMSLDEDYRVSCLELDVAVDSAVAAGALGARMTGGGFGGSAIALVPVERHDEVERSVLAAFAARSLVRPRLFTAVPSAGAGRDR